MIRVLYIDDEPSLLTLTQIYLREEANLEVEVATSALTGLDLLKTQNYDAIVSDYDMPEIDGIEFLKQVREFDIAIPFIIFTGKGREEVAIEALNNGADFYIQKGGEPHTIFTELANAISHLVRRSHAERSALQNEQHLRAFLNAMPDLAYMKDPHLQLIYINPAYQKYLGLSSQEEAIGKTDRDLLPPTLAATLHDADATIQAQQIPIALLHEKILQIQLFPLPYPDGQTGIGGIIREISDPGE